MKFLIVDDSVSIRRDITRLLRQLGYTRFVEAPNGEIALKRFDSSIKCIITDWNMPYLDGLGLVRAIRARDDGKDVFILMVMPLSLQDGLTTQALEAGVNDIIIKPIASWVLGNKIEALRRARRKESTGDFKRVLGHLMGLLRPTNPTN